MLRTDERNGGRRRGWPGSLVVVSALVLSVATAQAPAGASPAAGRLDDRPTPFGISLGRWTGLWWDWAYAPPVHDPPYTGPVSNPLVDQTGADCGVGQAGPVWFLAGLNTSGSVTRSCTVPAGKELFFPLINIEGDNIGVVPPLGPGQIRRILTSLVDTTTELHLSIDGTNVPQGALFADRVASPVFSYSLPPQDNIVQGFEDGQGYIFPVLSDGYWVMLKPLSSGAHVIDFGGSAFGGFSLDVTYDLTVAPSSAAREKATSGSIHTERG